VSGRSTKACSLCGRLIYADHNLFHRNYDRHVEACPRQQKESLRRAIKKAGGVGVVPLPGQLALPHIAGVREVVE